jgi:hypothetical protein
MSALPDIHLRAMERHLEWVGDFALVGDLEGAFEEMEDVRALAGELEDVPVAIDGA